MEEPFLVGSTPRLAPLRSYADFLIILANDDLVNSGPDLAEARAQWISIDAPPVVMYILMHYENNITTPPYTRPY
jgi:hypothetical protein